MTAKSTSSNGSIIATIRPPFLALVPVCVLVGAASVVRDGHTLDPVSLVLVLVGALAAHIAVNTLNEYDDFRSGLDQQTTPTPFSGGSGTLPNAPQMAQRVLVLGLAAVVVICAVGVYFILRHGWALLPLGLAGILVIVAYTPLLTRSVLLCLIAPGLGFGAFMVVGTHFCLSGHWSTTSFVASLVPFFLVNNLLLINQFPDLQADARAGRRHLIIAHGIAIGVRVYIVFVVLTYVSIIAGVLLGLLPVGGLLGLLTLPLAVRVVGGLRRYASQIPQLVPFLGQNVVLTLATPVLMAVGVFVG